MSEPEKKPESISGALGVGAVILIALATGLSILGRRTKVLDPEVTFAGWFEPAELPFGWAPTEAARQADGKVLLHLADPAVAPEPEPVEPEEEEEEPEDEGADAPRPRFDWSAIAVGPEGTPPVEGLFVTWPLEAARAQLESLFDQRPAPEEDLDEQSRAVDPLEGLGAEGGRRVIGSGRLDWGEFEAPFVHERKFERGGTFVDTLRCNLSGEREALVLFLRWPRGLPASRERALELLSALERVAAPQG